MRAVWLLVLPACVMRAALPTEGTAHAKVTDAVAARVRCETGPVPIEFDDWRAAVERSGVTDALIDSATLTCRSVVVGVQPVVVGSNTPSIITLQQTELELQVVLRWRLERGCVRERWLGLSRWRVIQQDDDVTEVTAQVSAALHEAATNAQLESQLRLACPSPL